MAWVNPQVLRQQPIPDPWHTPHGFTHQKEPKNVQNGPELKEIGLISMNFTKSVISPSVLQGGTGIKKNYPGSNFLLRPPPSTLPYVIRHNAEYSNMTSPAHVLSTLPLPDTSHAAQTQFRGDSSRPTHSRWYWQCQMVSDAFNYSYCTNSINSSVTMTRDTSDENMVSSDC